MTPNSRQVCQPVRTDYKTYLYLRSRKKTRDVVRGFCRWRPWLDPDELEADADEVFVGVVDRYDVNSDAEFETFLAHRVLGMLKDVETRAAREWEVTGEVVRITEDLEVRQPEPPQFDLNEDVFDRVGGDAKTVLSLLFNTPADLCRMFSDRKEQTPDSIRVGLAGYLTAAGWSVRQVYNAFDEIRRVISD